MTAHFNVPVYNYLAQLSNSSEILLRWDEMIKLYRDAGFIVEEFGDEIIVSDPKK